MATFITTVRDMPGMEAHYRLLSSAPRSATSVSVENLSEAVLSDLPKLAEACGGTLGLVFPDRDTYYSFTWWCRANGHECNPLPLLPLAS